MDPKDIMTGYERRLANCKRHTAADLLKSDRMVATAMKDILGTEVVRKLESGEEVNLPFAYDILLDWFKYLKENPGKIDPKVLSSVLGELKLEVSGVSETASDVFGGIAIGEK